ncbi:hypothetical protein [Janthinobacterium sp. YR213]|uniref:hypothetical protein n=1 Tax=Janthinobacterium sp. YR213 TaxID=1881027 RepID=UPI00147ADAEC|nr:hypothetical protein [Janthinobacterium sp. YR213]
MNVGAPLGIVKKIAVHQTVPALVDVNGRLACNAQYGIGLLAESQIPAFMITGSKCALIREILGPLNSPQVVDLKYCSWSTKNAVRVL